MPVKAPWRSAVFWMLENLALELLRRRSHHSARLRYDDLASDPQQTLGASLAALGIEEDFHFLRTRTLHLGPNHLVAGNPLRFRRGELSIEPDLEWLTALEGGDRQMVTALTWPFCCGTVSRFRLALRALQLAGVGSDDARNVTSNGKELRLAVDHDPRGGLMVVHGRAWFAP